MKTVALKLNTPTVHRYGLMLLSLVLGIVTCTLVG
jgi:hypothetical protein